MADKGLSQVDYSQIQKGMALRVKYRLHPSKSKRKMMLSNLGIHMMNRGLHDIYPNGDDVRALGLRLIPGFDYAEANHNGVAVEEIPASVQAEGIIIFRDPVTKEVYEGIGEYNYKHCSGSEYLGTCFDKIEARSVLAGTLSYSHLLLVLLSVRSKAKWKTYDEAKEKEDQRHCHVLSVLRLDVSVPDGGHGDGGKVDGVYGVPVLPAAGCAVSRGRVVAA